MKLSDFYPQLEGWTAVEPSDVAKPPIPEGFASSRSPGAPQRLNSSRCTAERAEDDLGAAGESGC